MKNITWTHAKISDQILNFTFIFFFLGFLEDDLEPIINETSEALQKMKRYPRKRYRLRNDSELIHYFDGLTSNMKIEAKRNISYLHKA